MSLKILSWNILSGGFKDYGSMENTPGRFDGLVAAIKSVNADIVSLVDTYRWTEIFTLEKLKECFGYPNAFIVKLDDQRLIEKGHDNGITVLSRIPETNMFSIRLANRNAIVTRVQGFNIFSVYLDDLNEDTRLSQIQALLKLLDKDSAAIITGDFNTFNSADLEEITSNLASLKMAYEAPMKAMEETLNQMKRGEVVQTLSSNGFRDIGLGKGNTVPAKLFPLKSEKPLIRLDYAFANNKIKLEDFKVLTDETFGNLSDHYPIMFSVSS